MLFISWSGSPSKEIGNLIKKRLRAVFDELEIFFSEEMQPGRRWASELSQGLEKCQIGLFIYTRQNLDSLWMAFEAGALSKHANKGQVIPLIFGANNAELTGPLAQFQARGFTREGILHVLKAINEHCLSAPKSQEYIDNNLDVIWPTLKKDIEACLEQSENHLHRKRSTDEMLDSIDEMLNSIYSQVQTFSLDRQDADASVQEMIGEIRLSRDNTRLLHEDTRALHEDTKDLMKQVQTTLYGSYLYIDGEEPAFSALIAATQRAKKCIRSTRFSPMSISGNQDAYGQAIRSRILGDDPVERYVRIIAANYTSKLRDIEEYLRDFKGKNFDLFLTKKTSSFEMVTIDNEEALIHFYGKSQVINSTLGIIGKDVTQNFIKVYEQLVDPNYDPEVLKIEFKYMREDEVEGWRNRIREFFSSCCDMSK